MKKILIFLIAAFLMIMLYAIAYYSSVDDYEFETIVLTMGIVGILYTCTHIAFVIAGKIFKSNAKIRRQGD